MSVPWVPRFREGLFIFQAESLIYFLFVKEENFNFFLFERKKLTVLTSKRKTVCQKNRL